MFLYCLNPSIPPAPWNALDAFLSCPGHIRSLGREWSRAKGWIESPGPLQHLGGFSLFALRSFLPLAAMALCQMPICFSGRSLGQVTVSTLSHCKEKIKIKMSLAHPWRIGTQVIRGNFQGCFSSIPYGHMRMDLGQNLRLRTPEFLITFHNFSVTQIVQSWVLTQKPWNLTLQLDLPSGKLT